MGLGDLLSDTIDEVKETYSEHYKYMWDDVIEKKLDIILNVMDTLRMEADMFPNYPDVMSKEDKDKIELLYLEINEKTNMIQELLKKTVKDCKDNYKWDEKISKYVKI